MALSTIVPFYFAVGYFEFLQPFFHLAHTRSTSRVPKPKPSRSIKIRFICDVDVICKPVFVIFL